MKDVFLQLISPNHGQGPSSTRFVYVLNGMAAVLGALIMTTGGMIVYCNQHRADETYWLATGALWGASLGFATRAKTDQQKQSKEIALGRSTPVAASAVSGD